MTAQTADLPRMTIDRFLHTTVWWDGPMAGLCEVDGVERYFACEDEDEHGNRTFTIYDMPLDVRAELEHARVDFRRMVGDHSDVVKRGPNDPPVTPETQAAYYLLHPPDSLPKPERMTAIGVAPDAVRRG